jgi:thioredoxin-dependent peroxiredoxin
MLKEHTQAPDFCLTDQNGNTHCLADYKGKQVLLYFYPKDDTPGCTKEACAFRDTHASFASSDIIILGISSDDKSSHLAFAQKYDLPFPLLADTERHVIRAYSADGTLGTKRISYLISPEGTIAKSYESVSPESHATEVLGDATLRGLL